MDKIKDIDKTSSNNSQMDALIVPSDIQLGYNSIPQIYKKVSWYYKYYH